MGAPPELGPDTITDDAPAGSPSPAGRHATAERHAWVSLLGALSDDALIPAIRDLHLAVAARVFDAVPLSAPVRLAHRAVTGGVYGAVRLGLRAAARTGAEVAARLPATDPRPWSERSPRNAQILAAVHGIIDGVPDTAPHLDLPIRIRARGRDVPTSPPALRAAYPDASPRVVVFLHGLTETEHAWKLGVGRPDRPDRIGYPEVLRELGWTPVLLRYGTGRAIADNGAELALLLEELVDGWPVEVRELALVGHSMGGLVIRSACIDGSEAGRRWVGLVCHTVSLGTPHFGAPLEIAVERLNRRLRRVPEGRIVADILDRRSRGIKDLRTGAIVGADGTAAAARPPVSEQVVRDADDRARHGRVEDPPLLEDVTHHLVAGRLTRSQHHPVTRVFGDLLVTIPSAHGRHRDRQLRGGSIEVLAVEGGHFRLLSHPEVADHLRRWLT